MFINVIKETFSEVYPLFDGNLQLEDYSGRYEEAKAILEIDREKKTAEIYDRGAYCPKTNTCSEKEWHGIVKKFEMPRFLTRQELADVIWKLRPVIKECFETGVIDSREIERICNLYYDEAVDSENEELSRQAENLAMEIDFDEKISLKWIRENVEPCFGRYDINDWQEAVEKATGENIDLLCVSDYYEISRALDKAEEALKETED